MPVKPLLGYKQLVEFSRYFYKRRGDAVVQSPSDFYDNVISESLFAPANRPDYLIDGYVDLLATQKWVAVSCSGIITSIATVGTVW